MVVSMKKVPIMRPYAAIARDQWDRKKNGDILNNFSSSVVESSNNPECSPSFLSTNIPDSFASTESVDLVTRLSDDVTLGRHEVIKRQDLDVARDVGRPVLLDLRLTNRHTALR
jgi:hypothetical protein